MMFHRYMWKLNCDLEISFSDPFFFILFIEHTREVERNPDMSIMKIEF